MRELISNHDELALGRLLYQYNDKEKLKDFITAHNIQVQSLEDASHELFSRLNIQDSIGIQLDRIGDLVGINRDGATDEEYRIILTAKIAQNVSSGDPERLISVFMLLTNADTVHYMNLKNGQMALASDGDFIDSDLFILYYSIIRSVAGGVRINYLEEYDADAPFSFEGNNTNAPSEGFGTTADVNEGGFFATMRRENSPFAFDGSDEGAQGFGTLEDVVLGGNFQAL